MSQSSKIDFLYLSESDMIEAGVLDGKKCIDTMCDVMELLSKGDYLLGGRDNNSHGIGMGFPKEPKFPGMPKDGPDRRYMAMPAYLGGRFQKTGQKWYGSNKENNDKGLPRSILMVTLNDADTGAPIAYMSGNLVSAMRTGAVPFVAARYVARKDSSVLSLIGAGVIGTASLRCAMGDYPNINTIKIKASSVTSRSAKRMEKYIHENYPQVEHVIICETLEQAIRDVDIICEAVSVHNEDDVPMVKEEWIKPGAVFLSSMNLVFEEDFLLNRASKIIDNWKMYPEFLEGMLKRQKKEGVKRPLGCVGANFLNLKNHGKLKEEEVPLIGDYVRGIAPKRKSEDEIFIIGACGMPIEDVGWGYDCYCNALEKGIGTKLNLWDEPYIY